MPQKLAASQPSTFFNCDLDEGELSFKVAAQRKIEEGEGKISKCKGFREEAAKGAED